MSPPAEETAPTDFADLVTLLEPTSKSGPGSRPDDWRAWLPKARRDMILARTVDTEAIALQRQGELAMWPSALGQEAAQVGAAHALRDQDMVFPTYREHALVLSRGVDPLALLGLFRGTTLGGWNPNDNNIAPYTLVIGAQTLHAVGYAMGIQRDDAVATGDRHRDRAVLVFLGDGALSEGETNEAFIWAAAQNLPVVFYCQNNQWAISSPFSVQSRVPAAQRAMGFGFPGVRVDGNDVLACRQVAQNALDRARSGGGPTLIEAVTYRRNPHTTSDDDTRYRSKVENDFWAERDPIARATETLDRDAPEWREAGDEVDLEERVRALSERLRLGCRALPNPSPDEPFRHTYAEMTAELAHQLEEHLAFVGQEQP